MWMDLACSQTFIVKLNPIRQEKRPLQLSGVLQPGNGCCVPLSSHLRIATRKKRDDQNEAIKSAVTGPVNYLAILSHGE